jgi:hypothetical protein
VPTCGCSGGQATGGSQISGGCKSLSK